MNQQFSICLYMLYHKTIIVKLEWLVHQLSHPVWRSKRRWLRCGSCRSPFTSVWPWIHSSGLRPFGRLRNLLEKPHRNFSQHALWITIYQQFMDGQTKRGPVVLHFQFDKPLNSWKWPGWSWFQTGHQADDLPMCVLQYLPPTWRVAEKPKPPTRRR